MIFLFLVVGYVSSLNCSYKFSTKTTGLLPLSGASTNNGSIGYDLIQIRSKPWLLGGWWVLEIDGKLSGNQKTVNFKRRKMKRFAVSLFSLNHFECPKKWAKLDLFEICHILLSNISWFRNKPTIMPTYLPTSLYRSWRGSTLCLHLHHHMYSLELRLYQVILHKSKIQQFLRWHGTYQERLPKRKYIFQAQMFMCYDSMFCCDSCNKLGGFFHLCINI